ncbi:MAG: hypothetical protein WBA93_05130 [Microcoleaceae cyanobacterium]
MVGGEFLIIADTEIVTSFCEALENRGMVGGEFLIIADIEIVTSFYEALRVMVFCAPWGYRNSRLIL